MIQTTTPQMDALKVIDYFKSRGLDATANTFLWRVQGAPELEGNLVPCWLVKDFCSALSPYLYEELECEVPAYNKF